MTYDSLSFVFAHTHYIGEVMSSKPFVPSHSQQSYVVPVYTSALHIGYFPYDSFGSLTKSHKIYSRPPFNLIRNVPGVLRSTGVLINNGVSIIIWRFSQKMHNFDRLSLYLIVLSTFENTIVEVHMKMA